MYDLAEKAENEDVQYFYPDTKNFNYVGKNLLKKQGLIIPAFLEMFVKPLRLLRHLRVFAIFN